MELRRLLVIVRRRLALLVVVVLAGIAASYLGSSRASVYQARSTVYVGATGTAPNPTDEIANAFLASTLSTIAVSPTVIQSALKATGVHRTVAEVVKATKATAVPATNLILITADDRDPVVAKTLVNGIATEFIAGAKALTPLAGGKAPASVAQVATVPTAPLATSLHRNVALGAVAALGIGLAVILLIDFVGLSARTPKQLETQMGLSVIGVVPLQPQIERAAPPQQGEMLLAGDDD